MMGDSSPHVDVPVFVGERGASHEKDSVSRVRWMSAVIAAARSRRMVPVLWDTGHDVSRHAPCAPSAVLEAVLRNMR